MQNLALRPVPLHLGPGSDLRRSLEALAIEHQAGGFVLGVVGNLSQAAFQCPGQPEATLLQGDLEIITLQGTLSPQGVHLHLSFSDGACQVWGGHLEPGTLVLRGADLLVGLLEPAEGTGSDCGPTAAAAERVAPAIRTAVTAAAALAASPRPQPAAVPTPRVEIAVLEGCPYSARALRMLRTLGIPHRLVEPEPGHSLPQVRIDGMAIGGYDALADLHGRGALDSLRQEAWPA